MDTCTIKSNILLQTLSWPEIIRYRNLKGYRWVLSLCATILTTWDFSFQIKEIKWGKVTFPLGCLLKKLAVSLLQSDNACNQVVSKYFVYFTGVSWVTAVSQGTLLIHHFSVLSWKKSKGWLFVYTSKLALWINLSFIMNENVANMC